MPTYTFIVQPDGKLPIGMKETLGRVIPSYAGKKVRLGLEEARDKRSLDQNAYYWAAIVPHVRMVRLEMGDPVTIEHTHEDLLAEFAPTVTSKKTNGASYVRPMRSKEMNVKQMADYITAVTAVMAQMQYPVPLQENYNG